MKEQEIRNQIQTLQNSLNEIIQSKHDINLYISILEKLGFEEFEKEENNFCFQKLINESYYYWIEKQDDKFAWGIWDDENCDQTYESDEFQDFEECQNDYLNNKDFFQIKTLKATFKINRIVDTRDTFEDLKDDIYTYVNNSDQFELEVLD
jgi:hypothetical protein